MKKYQAAILPEIAGEHEEEDFKKRSERLLKKYFRSHFSLEPTYRDEEGHIKAATVNFVEEGMTEWRDMVRAHANRRNH